VFGRFPQSELVTDAASGTAWGGPPVSIAGQRFPAIPYSHLGIANERAPVVVDFESLGIGRCELRVDRQQGGQRA
jgi:hypothetical protein